MSDMNIIITRQLSKGIHNHDDLPCTKTVDLPKKWSNHLRMFLPQWKSVPDVEEAVMWRKSYYLDYLDLKAHRSALRAARNAVFRMSHRNALRAARRF